MNVLAVGMGGELEGAVRHALEAGARKQEIVETIGQMSVFAGIPAMTRALDLAQEVMGDNEDEDQ